MKSAPIPHNDAQRVAALVAHDVLDTAPEPAFDAITAVTARLLGVPIVLVSLVDAERQWFKSRYGLDAPHTPRDVSFCGHVVASERPLIVPDAWRDDRFADNPLVTGQPRVRFYAGMPLRTADGFVLGTLCAIDHEPRELCEADATLLAKLAQQVVDQLELRRVSRVLARENQRLVDYERFFDLSLELLATFNDKLHFELLSPSWTKVLGYSADELRAVPCLDFVHPDDLERTKQEASRLLSEKGTTVRFENRYRHKDGSWVWFSWTSVVVDGTFYGAARDITAYKAKERALRDREEQQRALLEGMVEGVVLQVRSGAIAMCNPAAESILGLTRDQMMGRTSIDPRWRSVRSDGSPFPGDEHPAMEALRTGQPQHEVIMGVHKASGELTWISINSQPMFHPHQSEAHAVITTFRDITQQRAAAAAAQRIARQERLITTGTLAAGVGHEINNPLSYVLTNIEFAIEELRSIGGSAPSTRIAELARILSDARDGGERVRKIVRGLRALAREASEPVPTSIAGCVELSASIAMHELRHKATLTMEIEPDIEALADESRLSQVLVNLLVNAAQAFESSDPSHNHVLVRARRHAPAQVVIEVQDNGPGMSEEVRARVFDPFFTTKPTGQGTGLGLSISHSIVVALGGELTVHSQRGQGATFRIVLPSSSSAAAAEARTGVAGRVLVVDDEVPILTMIKRLLQSAYEVVIEQDPRAALERVAAGERFDVIYCDLMMPHLTGVQFHAMVAELQPQLVERIVFISGGVVSAELRAELARLDNRQLDKPFSMQALRELTHQLVAQRRAA